VRQLAPALVVLLVACSANDDLPSPAISAISPDQAAAASVVVISGNYFCHQPATEDPLACDNIGTVEFGATAAIASQYTDTAIMAEVPSGQGSVEVVVVVAGHSSNAVGFTIE
jgi:hypothetical protein